MTNILLRARAYITEVERGPNAEACQSLDYDLARALLDLYAECERMRAFVTDIADEDCSYSDDCPSSSRHYRCMRCKAKDALAAATKEPR